MAGGVIVRFHALAATFAATTQSTTILAPRM
jgi:hypothetical protein